MNEDRIDAEIRAAFEAIEVPDSLAEKVGVDRAPQRVTWRSEAISVGLAAAAALALFIPWMMAGEAVDPTVPAAAVDPGFQPPSGTRLVTLEVAGAQEGWPEAGAVVDILAVSGSADAPEVTTLLHEAVVSRPASVGAVELAVDPTLAVRAVHGNQTDALFLSVVLPDGRRVVELQETSPVEVGDLVDVLVTAEKDGGLATWTALTGAEVVYLGAQGPLVAITEPEAATAVSVQHIGTIRLSRHLREH